MNLTDIQILCLCLWSVLVAVPVILFSERVSSLVKELRPIFYKFYAVWILMSTFAVVFAYLLVRT